MKCNHCQDEYPYDGCKLCIGCRNIVLAHINEVVETIEIEMIEKFDKES